MDYQLSHATLLIAFNVKYYIAFSPIRQVKNLVRLRQVIQGNQAIERMAPNALRITEAASTLPKEAGKEEKAENQSVSRIKAICCSM